MAITPTRFTKRDLQIEDLFFHTLLKKSLVDINSYRHTVIICKWKGETIKIVYTSKNKIVVLTYDFVIHFDGEPTSPNKIGIFGDDCSDAIDVGNNDDTKVDELLYTSMQSMRLSKL